MDLIFFLNDKLMNIFFNSMVGFCYLSFTWTEVIFFFKSIHSY